MTAPELTFTTAPTPAGMFGWLTVTDEGSRAVIASGWTTDPAYLASLARVELALVEGTDDQTAGAVAAFFSGEHRALDEVVVRQRSGPFIDQAWRALRGVAPGERITYTELAARAQNPRAVRAAASACATNRTALFVPCHRVLRTDGTLGGFRYGLDCKRALLAFESRAFADGSGAFDLR